MKTVEEKDTEGSHENWLCLPLRRASDDLFVIWASSLYDGSAIVLSTLTLGSSEAWG